MSHGNAMLTPAGRLLMVQRVAAGEHQAEVARQMNLSRATVSKWWHRWVEHGDAGLVDRSSRPRRSPRRTDAKTEERICRLRRSTGRGPVYLSARTGVPASTVWRILRRHGLNRLDRLDRPTGRVVRRYEKSAPGGCLRPERGRRRQSRHAADAPEPGGLNEAMADRQGRQASAPPLPIAEVYNALMSLVELFIPGCAEPQLNGGVRSCAEPLGPGREPATTPGKNAAPDWAILTRWPVCQTA